MFKRVVAVGAIALSLCVVCSTSQAQTIEPYIGTGLPTTNGDGGPAATASIYRPTGLALDDAGTLFIAETYGSRIRKVALDGTITTVAGNGSHDYSGDGGPAVEASLSYPHSPDLDSRGNLYFVDSNASRIRQVGVDGIIRTIAGNGTAEYAPDGPAIGHPLNFVFAVAAADDGTVYFSEAGNLDGEPLIRKITPVGQIVTIVGTHTGVPSVIPPGPGHPGAVSSMHLERDGRLLVADHAGFVHRIAADGTVTTIAGGGTSSLAQDEIPALSATLLYPQDAVSDANGNVYVVDEYRVRRIDAAGVIHAFAGQENLTGDSGDGGPARNALLNLPQGALVDRAGNVLISDTLNHRVRKVVAFTTCAAEGYRGSRLALCRQICEGNHDRSLPPLIAAYLRQFGEAPACAR